MAHFGEIVEVFRSFQGEGQYIGACQVFIRLAGCRFSCPYCDTQHSAKDVFFIEDKAFKNPIDATLLAQAIVEAYSDRVHSYSFTGGEPLLQEDFLHECALEIKKLSTKKLFLETSGLARINPDKFDGLFDIISADIKTYSDDALENLPDLLANLSEFKKSSYYLKLVLPNGADFCTVDKIISDLVKFKIKNVILQPVDNIMDNGFALELFDRFGKVSIDMRIIPQTHKLLNFR